MRAHRRDNFLFSSFMSYNTICFARLRCPFTSLTARLAAAKRHNRSPILIIPASYSLDGLCSLSLNWIKPRRRASWLDLFIFPDVLYYSPGYYGRVWAASKSEISSHLYLSLFFLSLSLGSQFFPAHPFDDYLVYSSDFLFLLTLIEIRAMSAQLPHAPFPSPSRSGVGNHNCKRTAYKSHLVFWKTEFRYFFLFFLLSFDFHLSQRLIGPTLYLLVLCDCISFHLRGGREGYGWEKMIGADKSEKETRRNKMAAWPYRDVPCVRVLNVKFSFFL